MATSSGHTPRTRARARTHALTHARTAHRYTHLVIRGATPLEVIAYLMDLNGRHFRSRINPEVDVRCA